MLAVSKTSVICDFAETYHILDFASLPAHTAAALASGLGDDSRIIRKLRGESIPREVMLQAVIADRLGLLIAGLGGQKETPPSILDALLGKEPAHPEKDIRSYQSGAEFEQARNEILRGIYGN